MQAAYNLTLGSTVRQDLHAGLQWSSEAEDLLRYSNGWGSISVPGGRLTGANPAGPDAYYMATYLQQTTGLTPSLHSEYHSLNIEANDTITWKNLVLNAGFVFSSDTLYGQGLREDSSKVSGFVAAPGNKYKIYRSRSARRCSRACRDLGLQRQGHHLCELRSLRAGRQLPAPSRLVGSEPNNQFIDAYFDQNGLLIDSVPRGSSSGKMFVQNMTPRTTPSTWSAPPSRSPRRCRGGPTSATATPIISGRTPTTTRGWSMRRRRGFPETLYIPDLSDMLTQIGSGSSYVITELDGRTRGYETTLEGEWRTRKSYLRGSYTWTRYRGNFDQDATTAVNDADMFMGSSYIGDGVGRQLWDFRDGTLHGDRPLSFKLYGYYMLTWHATAGAYTMVQSGQPWEKRNYVPYLASLDQHDRNGQVRRAGRVPADADALPARPELHAGLPPEGPVLVPAVRRLVQRVQQANRVQLQPVHRTARSSTRRATTWIRGVCRLAARFQF